MESMRVVVFGAVAMTMGCMVDEVVSESVTEQALKPKPGDGSCGAYGCGQNTPDIDGIGFTRLSELGVANPQKIRIKEFQAKAGGTGAMTIRKPNVIYGELIATNASGQTTEFGTQLQGAIFFLENVETHVVYQLKVLEVHPITTWTTPVGNTFSYWLQYTNTAGRILNLCKQAGAPTGDTMNPFDAVLFDDDLVNEETLVFEKLVPNWFTIGCAGSALAKVDLMGKTEATSKKIGVATSLGERTAALKAMTADYCGTGSPFTVAGIPLHLRDRNGVMNNVVVGERVEALFSELGAVCMTTPRLRAHPTAYSQSVFPSSTSEAAFLAYIGTYCTLPPPCTQGNYVTGYVYSNGATMLTTNPLP